MWIYFETSTYDEIERDKKVTLDSIAVVFVVFAFVSFCICLGDLGGSAWTHWRHYGTPDRLLHSQWGGNPLLYCNALDFPWERKDFPLERKDLLQEREGKFRG